MWLGGVSEVEIGRDDIKEEGDHTGQSLEGHFKGLSFYSE